MHPNDNTAERVVFEKKYFDYLPNDLDSEDVTDEDVTHELDKDAVSPEHKIADENNARRVNSRRFRRDLSNESRRRRQSIIYVPLVHYRPYSHVDFYFPQNFHSDPMPSPFQTRYYARAPNPTSFLQNPTNLNTQSNTNQWAYNPKMFSGDRYLPPPNPEAKWVRKLFVFIDYLLSLFSSSVFHCHQTIIILVWKTLVIVLQDLKGRMFFRFGVRQNNDLKFQWH